MGISKKDKRSDITYTKKVTNLYKNIPQSSDDKWWCWNHSQQSLMIMKYTSRLYTQIHIRLNLFKVYNISSARNMMMAIDRKNHTHNEKRLRKSQKEPLEGLREIRIIIL